MTNTDTAGQKVRDELATVPADRFADATTPVAPASKAVAAPPPAVAKRRRRTRAFWGGVIVLPWAITGIVMLSRPTLRQLDKTGLAITRAEAIWLAAWVLVAAAVLGSWIVRRFAAAPAQRDDAEASYAKAQRATTDAVTGALLLPPGDLRSEPTVSTLLGAQQTALVKREVAVVAERRSGLRGVLIGADGRASTSKLQAAVWTTALLYAFLYVLLAGWHLVTRPETPKLTHLVDGFAALLKHPLQPEYVVLLGIPMAAAVAAKALVTGKIQNGTLVKPPSTDEGVAAGIAEVVSHDDGNADLLDFQYAAFNAILLVYFFATFLGTTAADPSKGLPSLPATLLALAGVSAATYVAKKSLESSTAPQILGVSPRLAVIGQDLYLSVTGSGFLTTRATPLNAVTLGGVPVGAEVWTATSVTVSLPASITVARTLGLTAGSRPLVVTDDEGNNSSPYLVQIALPAVGA
jgi:hypothetical protein